MRYKKLLGLVILLCSLNANVMGQESKYQALFIYNFTKYMNWSSEQTVIGVVGNSQVLLELEALAKRNPQKIKVIKIAGDANIFACNMIFIPEAQSRNFSLIQSKVGSAPIIIIAESETLIKEGAEIAFYTENDKLKFVLNKSAVDDSKVQISNSLFAIARVVY